MPLIGQTIKIHIAAVLTKAVEIGIKSEFSLRFMFRGRGQRNDGFH